MKKLKLLFVALLSMLCLFALLAFTACETGGDNGNNEPPQSQKQDYDMSGVIFGDLTVEYDGQEHSIIATNLPAGVNVSYDGNNQTEIGTHTVTAHFTGDSVNYNAIPDKTATLTITQPAQTKIESATGFEIDETGDIPRLYCEVPYTTQYIDLSNNITVTINCTWKLFEDFIGSTELVLKSMELAIGHNTAYIIVYTPNGDFVRYQVDIYRLDMKSYTFKNVDNIYESGTIEEKSSINAPQNPERVGYTFIGWAVEGSSEIVKFPYTVTETITFVAQYETINYKITYHLNGGENNKNNPESYNIETGTDTLLSATRTDYTFMGWFEDSKFETQVTKITLGSHGDKDLYAKWAYGTEGLTYFLSGSEYMVTGYNGASTNVTIPEEYNGYPVTSIGDYAFFKCTSLVSITLPDSVTAIGNYAFQNCTGIESISIPDSVTSIGYEAFGNCISLNTVYWNATNCTLESTLFSRHIFSGCSALTNAIIGDSVQTIPSSAFSGCTSLESVTIGNGVTEIGVYAFRDCISLESVIIGNGVTSIGSYAFDGCTSLTSITIPNSVASIGNYAFQSCTSLTSVTIGNNVTEIGDYAFEGCSGLSSITIPDSVTSISRGAFRDCTSLDSVTIGNGVTSIGHGVFRNCTSLVSITIPDSVTEIGDSAFDGCSNLTSITIPDNVTYIGSSVFRDCTSLESVTIPNNVTFISDSAFRDCTSLESITIPNNVTFIGDSAFEDCTSLTSVTIPGGVTYIGSSAFYNCTSLKTVYWNATNCTSAGEESYPIFRNCTVLTNVVIGDNVQTIPDYAFSDCTSLENITIPNNVTKIGWSVFEGCTSLTSITIPKSVTSIGYWTFNGCTSLEIVYYGGTAEQWTKISISYSNDNLLSATRYYYSEEYPYTDEVTEGNFWHYDDVTGEIDIWVKQ